MQKEVTKEEFKKFLDDYPRPLTYDFCQIPEPPVGHYYDLSLPEGSNIVGLISFNDYWRRPNQYYIEEINKVYLVYEAHNSHPVATKAFTHESTRDSYVNSRAIAPFATGEIELIYGELVYPKQKFSNEEVK